ncbi:hypothetical protein GPALN_001885 [Globodera pallida]|nr:hypothetical protein GPALN_001885 [Globodera pallida]
MSSGKFDWLLSSLTPESQVPSTAEIIQKCLSVNPFDLKFREANLQNNGQGGQSGSDRSIGNSCTLPTTSGLGSILNLPSTLSSLSSTHSPGIFSNINVLTADIEGELRKTIDLSRKVQQVNANFGNGRELRCARTVFLSKQEDGQLKTPCTSDVLNAVLDMQHINGNAAQHNALGNCTAGPSSPFISSTSLLAGLSGLKAALTGSVNPSGQECGPNQLVPTNSIPNFKVETDLAHVATGCSSFTPVGIQGKTMSSPDLHAQSIISSLTPNSKQRHSPVSPHEALLALQQASCSSTLSVPVNPCGLNNSSFSAQSSPGGSGGSLRSSALSPSSLNGSGLTELIAPSRISPMLSGNSGDDPWKIGDGTKQPICPPQISISQQSPYAKGPDSVTSKTSSDMSKESVHNIPPGGKEKTRKYTKFCIGSADSQVSSTRGGRGRRSIINEMLPDERRHTILERNKAAAVRYRKRKK